MTSSTIRFARPRRRRRDDSEVGIKIGLSLVIGAALFFLIVIAIVIGYGLVYAGRVFPGVTVAGVDISGLERDDAAIKIQSTLSFPGSGRIVLRDGQNVWVVTPENLGMRLDTTGSAQRALDFGRDGGFFENINDRLNAAQVGVILAPEVVFDQRLAYSYLQELAKEVDRPLVEASLVINGLDVSSHPGQVGRKLDIESTLVYVQAQMQLFRDGEVPLVFQEQPPQVMDASSQADAARRLLSAPFILSIPDAREGDPGPWAVEPAELAPMLRVGRLGNGPGSQYVVQLDQDKLQALLERIAAQVDRPEADARFLIDEQTFQLIPVKKSVVGLKVNLRNSIQEIQKAIGSGQQSAQLNVKVTEPLVADTATNIQLGITELVSAQTTYFFGSSEARRKNIETAAANFNGLLVPPGATFSMGEHMGDVSLDAGYAEALIIYNGKTIKGVGGGVCQVSTTLFRTVFFAGYPVVERHAHAYRVYYYEQGPGGRNDPSLSGFDATVYFPLIDFKFTNDSPYWILMETFYDSDTSSLTWKFFSTSDGRTVEAIFSGPTNIVPALPPVISFNPDAAPGSVAHVDYAAEGADITITRTVRRGGNILDSQNFLTHYQPWADTCEYGPDVADPEKILKKRGWCQKP